MRHSLLVLASLAAAVSTVGAWAAGAGASEPGPRHVAPRALAESRARVIVQFRSGASILASSGREKATAASAAAGPQLASTLGQRLGLSLQDGRVLGARMQVIHGSGLSSQQLVQALSAQSDVEWAVVDGRRFALSAPNDPLYADGNTNGLVTGQWYLRAPTAKDSQGNAVVSAVDVETAWSVTKGSKGLVVAVLDTGIRSNHPDLVGKLVQGYDFITDTEIANDGSARDIDPSDPGDWITSAEDASGTFKGCGAGDSSWHGTQTASLIGAAADNGIGMAGVAPNVKIQPVRVLGKCGGYDSDIVAGMRWAAGLSVPGVPANPTPAKVLNMSLGSTASCSALYQSAMSELTAANVTVVAAAGNEGLAVGVPANCPGVIAVAGLRHSGTKVGYSSLGPEVVVAAPAGNCVLSTTCLYPILTATDTGTTSPVSSTYSDGTNYSVGTSFSSPIVAGTVALMLSANPVLSPQDLTALLKSTARAFPSTGADAGVAACHAPTDVAQDSECYCTTTTCGAGMLDAGSAVKAALQGGRPSASLTLSASALVVGQTITLSAADSVARSGGTLSYQWSLVTGAGLGTLTANGSEATFKASAAGQVVARLVVTEGGQTSTVDRPILVLSTGPQAAITASTTEPVVGSAVTLSAAGSTGADSVPVRDYLWSVNSGASFASLSGSTTASTSSLSAVAAGDATVRLTVTDFYGLQATQDKVISVKAPSSGGGGAWSPLWALGLLLVGALVRPRRALRR